MGRDVSKLKAKGGGKWKYMTEKEMLEISAKFAPYRYVAAIIDSMHRNSSPAEAYSCGICGAWKIQTSARSSSKALFS
jgi:hypothetical protein